MIDYWHQFERRVGTIAVPWSFVFITYVTLETLGRVFRLNESHHYGIVHHAPTTFLRLSTSCMLQVWRARQADIAVIPLAFLLETFLRAGTREQHFPVGCASLVRHSLHVRWRNEALRELHITRLIVSLASFFFPPSSLVSCSPQDTATDRKRTSNRSARSFLSG